MLDVQNLMVFFENALALNDFSMEVREGQVVGVIGSNSVGKTTLMNTLSGLIIDMRIKEKRRGGERITVYGKVFFKGQDITLTRPSERVRKGIVLCRERHPIFPESDVLQNLRMAGYLRTKSEIRKNISEVFELFPALVPLKSRKAGFMSGGEQQMLAVGMALAPQTAIATVGRTPPGPESHDAARAGGRHQGLESEIGDYRGHQRAVCPARSSHDRFRLHH